MDEKLNPKDKVLLMRDEGEGNRLKVVKTRLFQMESRPRQKTGCRGESCRRQ
jgi:hypothetical protein